VRRCTTRHFNVADGGGREDGGAGGCWVLLEGVVVDEEVGGRFAGDFGVGGSRDLRVVRRREFKFFVDILNKVIIVLCSGVLLLNCCILL
jgi:hypothetical protein